MKKWNGGSYKASPSSSTHCNFSGGPRSCAYFPDLSTPNNTFMNPTAPSMYKEAGEKKKRKKLSFSFGQLLSYLLSLVFVQWKARRWCWSCRCLCLRQGRPRLGWAGLGWCSCHANRGFGRILRNDAQLFSGLITVTQSDPSWKEQQSPESGRNCYAHFTTQVQES